MKLYLVTGRFDTQGGKSSGWMLKFGDAMTRTGEFQKITHQNGGSLDELRGEFSLLADADVVLWAPEVDNSLPKFVTTIKAHYPKLLLVTSKQNFDGKYSTLDLIARALDAKANLLLEIQGEPKHLTGTILDPLGNVYASKEADVEVLAKALTQRIVMLKNFTRVASHSVGEALPHPPTPELEEFLELVREHAETFHSLIHAVHQDRLLGNASFRCTHGFPSFRGENDLIYVSRRNVDKRDLEVNSFVAARLNMGDMLNGDCETVEYFGPVKPSVDTPIQLVLYRYYTRARYMLHSHTYVQGGVWTRSPIPCGAMEEAMTVMNVQRLPSSVNFSVNLLGHGSLSVGDSPDFFRGLKWEPRPIPEKQGF
jgi:hypothetical protein